MRSTSNSVLRILVFISCGIFTNTHGQDYVVIKDFIDEWNVFQNNKYESYKQKIGSPTTIHFVVEANKYRGSYLHVTAAEPFTLFVNGQLASKSDEELRISVDSLKAFYKSPTLQISLHQNEILDNGLRTVLESKATTNQGASDPTALRSTSFRDFAIVGMVVLMILLIVIIQLNPKLASDYFSVTKIFSMREGDDSQAYSRITNSINILFYVYCSLMLGYYLMLVFHFLPAQYASALLFQSATFWDAIFRWLELSLIILGVFFFKIIIVYSLSFVFGIKEIGGIHFFNWVRLLLGVFGVLTIVLFLYFISHGYGQGFYLFLLTTISWVLAGWMVLIIFKLQRQMGHSMFHLFSYICATELIPFLITIKVIYF